MAIVGVDFSENAKALAQGAALIEVARFKLHVALSATHKAILNGDLETAEGIAREALQEAAT